MKTSPAGTIRIDRDLFIETMDAIQKQVKYDDHFAETIESLFPDASIVRYDNHLINNQIIKLLQLAFMDNHPHSWIEYFMFDLEFGSAYYPGVATEKDGKEIDLSDASHLYDFLLELANA